MARVPEVPNEPDPHHVAARLRAVLEPALRSSGLTAVAARLGVSPNALRLAVDFGDPRLSSAVAVAAVRQYGLDPTWLVTGEYDNASHRESLEEPARIDRLLARAGLRDSSGEMTPRRTSADRDLDERDRDDGRAR